MNVIVHSGLYTRAMGVSWFGYSVKKAGREMAGVAESQRVVLRPRPLIGSFVSMADFLQGAFPG